jgi:hypothetical protein
MPHPADLNNRAINNPAASKPFIVYLPKHCGLAPHPGHSGPFGDYARGRPD